MGRISSQNPCSDLFSDLSFEETRRLQKRLVQARLAEGSIHTINNMLMVLQAYGDRMRDFVHANEEALGLLKEMEEASRQISAATEALQWFAREESSPGWPIDLGRIHARVTRLMRFYLPRSIALQDDGEPDLIRLETEVPESQILQALLCLAVLAREETPEGGGLRLIAEPENDSRNVRMGLEAIAPETPVGGSPAPTPVVPRLQGALAGEIATALAEGWQGSVALGETVLGRRRWTLTIPCRPASPEESALPAATGAILTVGLSGYEGALIAGVLRGEGHSVEVYASAHAARAGLRKGLEPSATPLLLMALDDPAEPSGDQLAVLNQIGQNGAVVLICRNARERELPAFARGFHLLARPFAMRELTALIRQALNAQRQKGTNL